MAGKGDGDRTQDRTKYERNKARALASTTAVVQELGDRMLIEGTGILEWVPINLYQEIVTLAYDWSCVPGPVAAATDKEYRTRAFKLHKQLDKEEDNR